MGNPKRVQGKLICYLLIALLMIHSVLIMTVHMVYADTANGTAVMPKNPDPNGGIKITYFDKNDKKISAVAYERSIYKFIKNNEDHEDTFVSTLAKSAKKTIEEKMEKDFTESNVQDYTNSHGTPSGHTALAIAYYELKNNKNLEYATVTYIGFNGDQSERITIYSPEVSGQANSEEYDNKIYLSDYSSDKDFTAMAEGATADEAEGTDTIGGKIKKTIGEKIQDVLEAIFNWITTQVSKICSDILDYMTGNIFLIFHSDPSAFLSLFGNNLDILTSLKAVGYGILLIVLMLTLFLSMFGPIAGSSSSPLVTLLRFFAASFMIAYSYAICGMFFEIAQKAELIIGKMANSNVTSLKDIDVSFNGHAIYDFLNSLTADDMIAVVKLIFLILFTYEVFKLFLEIIERWLVLCVMYCISPIAMATYTSESTSGVFVSFFKAFFSQLAITVMTVWFLGALSQIITNAADLVKNKADAGNGKWDALLIMLAILAFVRVAQRIDEYLNTMGFSVARTGTGLAYTVSGAFLSSVYMARSTYRAGKNMAHATSSVVTKAGDLLNTVKHGNGYHTGAPGGGYNAAGGKVSGGSGGRGNTLLGKAINNAGTKMYLSKNESAGRNESNEKHGIISNTPISSLSEVQNIKENALQSPKLVETAVQSLYSSIGLTPPANGDYIANQTLFDSANNTGTVALRNNDDTVTHMAVSSIPKGAGWKAITNPVSGETLFAKPEKGTDPYGGNLKFNGDAPIPAKVAHEQIGNFTPEMFKQLGLQNQYESAQISPMGKDAYAIKDGAGELLATCAINDGAITNGIHVEDKLYSADFYRPVSKSVTPEQLSRDPVLQSLCGGRLDMEKISGNLGKSGKLSFINQADGRVYDILDAARNKPFLSKADMQQVITFNDGEKDSHIVVKRRPINKSEK